MSNKTVNSQINIAGNAYSGVAMLLPVMNDMVAQQYSYNAT